MEGLAIQIAASSFTVRGKSELHALEGGLLLRPGELPVPWPIMSRRTEGSRLLFFGNAFDGQGIEELRPDGSGLESALPWILRLVSCLIVALDMDLLPKRIRIEGVLRDRTGDSFLILPPFLVSRACEERRENSIKVDEVNMVATGSPDSDAALMIARLCSRIARYRATNREGSGEYPKHDISLPLNLAVPELHLHLSQHVDLVLESPYTARLTAWPPILEVIIVEGVYHTVGAKEEATPKRLARIINQTKKLKRKTREFLRHARIPLVVVAIMLGSIVVIAGSILASRSNVPDLSMLEPVDVARIYYQAVSDLDTSSFDACVRGSARNQDSRYLATLAVIVASRLAMDETSPLIDTNTWQHAGWPPLAKNAILHGITDLAIEGEACGTYIVLEARYLFWTTERGDDNADTKPLVRHRYDRLTFEQRHDGWKIIRIDRSEE
jgi:hypothetical protein